MGIDADGARQPQLRQGRGVPAQHADPARATSRSSRRTSSTRAARRRPSGRRRTCSRSAASRSAWSASQRRHPDARSSRARSIRSTSPNRGRGQRRGGEARDQDIDAIVAIGHDGATAGTLTDPTGRCVDIADAAHQRRRGDRRPHRLPGAHARARTACSSTENRSKGIRFTRVRLVRRTRHEGVVYKTADFHKPWDIGVTPDPTIQAKIDAAQRAAGADPQHA